MAGMYILGKKVLIGVYKLAKEARGMCSTRGLYFTTALYHGIHSFWILIIDGMSMKSMMGRLAAALCCFDIKYFVYTPCI